MEITLGHTYRRHATTETYISLTQQKVLNCTNFKYFIDEHAPNTASKHEINKIIFIQKMNTLKLLYDKMLA